MTESAPSLPEPAVETLEDQPNVSFSKPEIKSENGNHFYVFEMTFGDYTRRVKIGTSKGETPSDKEIESALRGAFRLLSRDMER